MDVAPWSAPCICCFTYVFPCRFTVYLFPCKNINLRFWIEPPEGSWWTSLLTSCTKTKNHEKIQQIYFRYWTINISDTGFGEEYIPILPESGPRGQHSGYPLREAQPSRTGWWKKKLCLLGWRRAKEREQTTSFTQCSTPLLPTCAQRVLTPSIIQISILRNR